MSQNATPAKIWSFAYRNGVLSMKLFGAKEPLASSSPLSDFLRNTKSRDKKRVYSKVIAVSSQRQYAILEAASRKA